MGGSGPNGEGYVEIERAKEYALSEEKQAELRQRRAARFAVPPHVVLTDELVDRYMARAPYWNEQMKDQAMSALNEVAPDIFEAGIRVGKAARDETQEDSDTARDVGTGGGYELSPGGEVRPAEED